MTSALDQLEALLAAATEGPWGRADWSIDDGPDRFTIEAYSAEVPRPGCLSIWPDGIVKHRVAETHEGERPDADAALIVAAVNSLPALLACARALEPFGRVDHHPDEPDHWPAFGKSAGQGWPTVGNFRTAAEALKMLESGK